VLRLGGDKVLRLGGDKVLRLGGDKVLRRGGDKVLRQVRGMCLQILMAFGQQTLAVALVIHGPTMSEHLGHFQRTPARARVKRREASANAVCRVNGVDTHG